MALKFFFGGEHASVAFQKEQDFPDWANSVYAAQAESGGTDDWSADPASIPEAGRTLDVRNIRRAVIALDVSGTDTYDFTVKNGVTSTNNAVWFDIDGGVYTTESGALFIGIDCLGLEYLAVVVDAVSGTDNLEIEMAPIPYETTES